MEGSGEPKNISFPVCLRSSFTDATLSYWVRSHQIINTSQISTILEFLDITWKEMQSKLGKCMRFLNQVQNGMCLSTKGYDIHLTIKNVGMK